MRGKIYISTASFFLLLFHQCLAQNSDIRFNTVLNNKGETLQKITGIAQDPHGYMWFAGQDAHCLYRYDGNRIISFRNDPLDSNSLGASNLETVYADNSGMIWIGFGGSGLDQFNPATGIFKHYRNLPNDDSSLGNNTVNEILEDKKGKIWVGTPEGLDCRNEKTGKFIHYRNKPGDPRSLSCNNVRAIYEDRRGTLWIGTGFPFDKNNDGGLNRMEKDGSFTQFLHDPKNPHSLINNKVRSIFEDSRGTFWIGTAGDGLHTMDREKGTFERLLYNSAKPNELSRPPLKKGNWTDHITFIGEDGTGAIWIGTIASGISRYDTLTKKITRYEYSNGFPSGSCWIAYISRDGVLWFGTQQNELFRVDPFRKKIDAITTGFDVLSFQEDKKGSLWVGTDAGGLFQFDKGKKLIHQFNNYEKEGLSLSNTEVRSLFQYQNDSLLLGTKEGMCIFNKIDHHFSRFYLETKYKDQFSSRTNSILRDKKGFMWFATGGGLIEYDPANGSLKEYQPDSKNPGAISSNRVLRVLEDKSGDIWAGTFKGGVNRLDRQTGQFRHYLTGFIITNMCQDSEGKIWIGTEKEGLYWYSKSSDSMLAYFDSHSGIDTLKIQGIIEDDLKNLWITMPSHIIKLNSARNKTYLFGEEYGIVPYTISQGICKTGKGEILIGHRSGFYVFSPNDLPFKLKPYKIIVTDFLINNLSVVNSKESPLVQPVEDIRTVSLKYYQNSIGFYFATTDYRSPESTIYNTMLENYDSSWREAGIDKSANYFNIPPGKYVFRVRAVKGIGTKDTKEIQIIITPPWWQTRWAYFVYGLLLVIAILGIDRFRKQRIIKLERQKTQLKELAQAKEIEKAYTELKSTQAQLIQSEKMASLGSLTAGIAHEIQNPLNFVNNFSEINAELLDEWKREINSGNMEAANSLAKDITENSEKIIEHGQRADSIVKSMLQHSRTSTGQKELTDINALSDEYLRLSYHGLRAKDKSFNSNFKTHFDPAIEKINIIPQDIGRVLLNLYNNAFYSVMEKKKMNSAFEPLVTVSTKKNGNNVMVTVTDNGIGIPEKLKDKIFQPFFTTKPTGQGTGLGLSLSYDIIKAHGGEIKVSAEKNEGVEFVIELPLI